jgi:hypothetical protein
MKYNENINIWRYFVNNGLVAVWRKCFISRLFERNIAWRYPEAIINGSNGGAAIEAIIHQNQSEM